MATVPVLDTAGKKVSERDLSAEIFEAKVSVPLMHQVVLAGMAGIRRGTHKVKTRAEVSGGGRKPWRQKGTGRARQGSSRSPQWTGGGVAHGPLVRDHSMRVNKKMRKGALRGALTDSLQSNKLVLIKELAFSEPKTKQAAQLLDTLELTGKVLVVLDQPTEQGATEKSFRNLEGVRIAYARSLGVYELIAADKILLTEASLAVVEGAPAESAGGSSTAKSAPSTDDAGDDSPGAAAGATPPGGAAGATTEAGDDA